MCSSHSRAFEKKVPFSGCFSCLPTYVFGFPFILKCSQINSNLSVAAAEKWLVFCYLELWKKLVFPNFAHQPDPILVREICNHGCANSPVRHYSRKQPRLKSRGKMRSWFSTALLFLAIVAQELEKVWFLWGRAHKLPFLSKCGRLWCWAALGFKTPYSLFTLFTSSRTPSKDPPQSQTNSANAIIKRQNFPGS